MRMPVEAFTNILSPSDTPTPSLGNSGGHTVHCIIAIRIVSLHEYCVNAKHALLGSPSACEQGEMAM